MLLPSARNAGRPTRPCRRPVRVYACPPKRGRRELLPAVAVCAGERKGIERLRLRVNDDLAIGREPAGEGKDAKWVDRGHFDAGKRMRATLQEPDAVGDAR